MAHRGRCTGTVMHALERDAATNSKPVLVNSALIRARCFKDFLKIFAVPFLSNSQISKYRAITNMSSKSCYDVQVDTWRILQHDNRIKMLNNLWHYLCINELLSKFVRFIKIITNRSEAAQLNVQSLLATRCALAAILLFILGAHDYYETGRGKCRLRHAFHRRTMADSSSFWELIPSQCHPECLYFLAAALLPHSFPRASIH